jgi:hypothetical protein
MQALVDAVVVAAAGTAAMIIVEAKEVVLAG